MRTRGDSQPGTWLAALDEPPLRRVLEAIHREPERDWTLASLAREAGMSRASFARRFTAGVGSAPVAYLTRWRLVRAAELLRETDLALAEIAARVGYTNAYAFATAFRRAHGLAPGRYRRTS